MDAILLLFLTGILSLFLGMKNKPVLNLCLNLVGLLTAGLLMGFHGTYEPLLKSFSETLEFEGEKTLVSHSAIALILFTALIQLASFSKEKNAGD
jgi:hypothetical protein